MTLASLQLLHPDMLPTIPARFPCAWTLANHTRHRAGIVSQRSISRAPRERKMELESQAWELERDSGGEGWEILAGAGEVERSGGAGPPANPLATPVAPRL